MKTNLFTLGLLSVAALNGCMTPRYVPKPQAIDTNQYGSLITIEGTSGGKIRGELIAADTSQLTVLASKGKAQWVAEVSVASIESFKLQYAYANYGWTVPLYALSTISHGWYLLLTLPANLIVTGVAITNGKKHFQYTEKTISYKNLAMFARFPQGIPPQVDRASIQGYAESE